MHLGVVARWSLTGAEALTLLGEPLSDEEERHEQLQGLLGAHRSLLLLVPDPARCTSLLHEPTPSLDGASMLQVMTRAGLSGIAQVRAHLLALLGRQPGPGSKGAQPQGPTQAVAAGSWWAAT